MVYIRGIFFVAQAREAEKKAGLPSHKAVQELSAILARHAAFATRQAQNPKPIPLFPLRKKRFFQHQKKVPLAQERKPLAHKTHSSLFWRHVRRADTGFIFAYVVQS